MKVIWCLSMVVLTCAFSDGAGTDYLYVSTGQSIYQVTPTGNTSLLATVSNPLSVGRIAADGAGHLYANGVGQVSRFGGGLTGSFAVDPFNDWILTDPAGNIVVGNLNSAVLTRYAPDGIKLSSAQPVRILGGLTGDAAGNLYVIGYLWQSYPINASPALFKVSPSGVVTQYTEAILDPLELAVDASGDLFTFNGAGPKKSLIEVTPAGDLTTIDGNLSTVGVLAFGSDGTLYFSQGPEVYTWSNGTESLLATLPDRQITSLTTSAVPVTLPEPACLGVLASVLTLTRRRNPQNKDAGSGELRDLPIP